VVLHGASFAGGLATIAEALRPLADLLVLQVPSLAWTEARVELCRQGSGREIARFLSARPHQAAAALHTLSFFDALHFAPAVTAPAIVGLGERDDVVPAMTVQALSERLAGPRELVRLPVSHSSSPLQGHWEEFEARWLTMAVEGVPVELERRSG
jgi:cephalosporin-C deacetylase